MMRSYAQQVQFGIQEAVGLNNAASVYPDCWSKNNLYIQSADMCGIGASLRWGYHIHLGHLGSHATIF